MKPSGQRRSKKCSALPSVMTMATLFLERPDLVASADVSSSFSASVTPSACVRKKTLLELLNDAIGVDHQSLHTSLSETPTSPGLQATSLGIAFDASARATRAYCVGNGASGNKSEIRDFGYAPPPPPVPATAPPPPPPPITSIQLFVLFQSLGTVQVVAGVLVR
jgi:hypothetical protein